MKQLNLYKGRVSVYLILILSVVSLMYLLQKCSSPIEKINKYERAGGDTINIAIEISPMSLSLSTDTIGGFYYDVLKLIGKKNNVKFKFHEFVPLSFALTGLGDGNFDIVVADIPATVELKEKYLLTEPIYIDHQVLVQRKEKTITDHYQLASDSIWVVAGSPIINRIQNLTDELGCDTIYVIETKDYASEQLVILTALGEIKQAVVNANIANNMVSAYPQLDVNTKISFSQFQVWALDKKNQKLCDKFNEWILDIKNTEEYKKLLSRYLLTKK